LTKSERYVRENLATELEEVLASPIAKVANGLTIYEKTLIYHYTKDGYHTINPSLRSSGSHPSEIVDLLIRALNKLPSHRGEVHRTTQLTQQQIHRYNIAFKNEKPVAEGAFTSASRSPFIGRLMPKFNVKFQMISRRGKWIEEISYMGAHTTSNEREVLFLPESEFRILEVTQRSRYVLIRMEEL
jgi:hypothetical protein